MRELIEFLNARLDDAEREAKAAQDVRGDYHAWHHVIDLLDKGMDEREALHIVTHSPARTLEQVAATRAIVRAADQLRGGLEGRPDMGTLELWTVVLKLLASVYSDHPDYRDDWRLT